MTLDGWKKPAALFMVALTLSLVVPHPFFGYAHAQSGFDAQIKFSPDPPESNTQFTITVEAVHPGPFSAIKRINFAVYEDETENVVNNLIRRCDFDGTSERESCILAVPGLGSGQYHVEAIATNLFSESIERLRILSLENFKTGDISFQGIREQNPRPGDEIHLVFEIDAEIQSIQLQVRDPAGSVTRVLVPSFGCPPVCESSGYRTLPDQRLPRDGDRSTYEYDIRVTTPEGILQDLGTFRIEPLSQEQVDSQRVRTGPFPTSQACLDACAGGPDVAGVCSSSREGAENAVRNASADETATRRAPGDFNGEFCGSQNNNQCWCVTGERGANLLQIGANVAAGVTLYLRSRSIPGTTVAPSGWTDPAEIDAPSAQPNQPVCEEGRNATVTAQVSGQTIVSGEQVQLFRAGDTVTITGEIGKLTNQCEGYSYDCRPFRQVACENKNRFYWVTHDARECPANLDSEFKNRIYVECKGQSGEDSCRTIQWGNIIATAGLILSTLGAAGIGPFAIPGLSEAGGPATTGGSQAAGAASTFLSSIGGSFGQYGGLSGYITYLISASDGGMSREELIQLASQAMVVGSQFAPGFENPSCFSICATDPQPTEFGPQPVCNGPVIGFEEGSYECGPLSCGGFESKTVRVTILDPLGNEIRSDTTTTDDSGKFSYTFNAPSVDGELTAVVAVPAGS